MKLHYLLSFSLLVFLSSFSGKTEKKPVLISAESVRTEAGREGIPREFVYTFVFKKNFGSKLKIKSLWIKADDKKIQYLPFGISKNDETVNVVKGKCQFTITAKRRVPTDQKKYKRFYKNILEEAPEDFDGSAGFIFEIGDRELFVGVEKMTKTEVVRRR